MFLVESQWRSWLERVSKGLGTLGSSPSLDKNFIILYEVVLINFIKIYFTDFGRPGLGMSLKAVCPDLKRLNQR